MFLAGAFALMATLAPGFGEAEERSSAARRGDSLTPALVVEGQDVLA
jgi:hypothetical protein